MLNKQKVKAFFMNSWVVTVGGGIILLGVPGIWDWIQKKEFLTTLKTVICFLWNLIIGFLNLQLRVWWILVAIAAGVLVLWIFAKVKEQESNESDFLKYTEDQFSQWKWSWSWEQGYDKKWHVEHLMAHCPKCDTRMQHDTYELYFRCPRCGFESHDVRQHTHEVKAVIYDNVLRAEKKKLHSINDQTILHKTQEENLMANKLELTWYGKDEPIRIEPRLLIENAALSNTAADPDTKNILIHGDNLLALKALEKKFVGQVKCIYIDPPYNTGSAFEHYMVQETYSNN